MQNGVLKALSFLFEYIGEMGKDYIYAITPLLEDALMDRDLARPRAGLPSWAVSLLRTGWPGLARAQALPCKCRPAPGARPPEWRPPAQVHRQTAASVVQHMAMGVAGLGCEDALVHLLNYVWPNVFETSPHVVNAVTGAIEGCRLALGPAIILNYVLQVPRPSLPLAAPADPAAPRGWAGQPALSTPERRARRRAARRACGTRPARCARSTGGCTTTCTSAPRTPWWPATRAWQTRA